MKLSKIANKIESETIFKSVDDVLHKVKRIVMSMVFSIY